MRLQIPVLLAFPFAVAFIAWAVTGHEWDVVITALACGLPAVIVASVLLYGQYQRGSRTQDSLQDVEARVSGIVESAMDPIVSIDERQRVILFNAAAERVFRWPRGAVLGQPVDMLLPQRFRDMHRQHVLRFAQTGVTSRQMGGSNVLTALRANGDEFPIEASISQHVEAGRKVLTVILRDITERGRAEHLLSLSEARLRGILDSAMDAVITVDESQRIVLFNAAAEKMFQCTQQQALGAPLAWLIPERFRDRHGEHVRAFGDTGVTSRRMGGARIVTGLRSNGEEFPIDASISQLSERGGKFYTVMLRDVSERVRAHEALARSKEELRELAAAAGKAREQEQSRIARELHDELAQAMSMLKMDVMLIGAAQPQEGDVRTRLAKMEKQIDTTIKAMRRIASDLRPLSLDDLGVFPAIESLVHDFEQRTGMRCELAIANPTRELDNEQATAVFRIVQESLTNVHKHARARSVEVSLLEDGDALTVTVRDDGVGFDPTKKSGGGFGLLGVRERAYLLGGTSTVTSAPGRGTEVEVTLPLETTANAT